MADFFSDETAQSIKKMKKSPLLKQVCGDQTKKDFGDAYLNVQTVKGEVRAILVMHISDQDRKGSFFKQTYEYVEKAGRALPKPSSATKQALADGILLNSFPYASGFFAGADGEVNIPINSYEYGKLILDWAIGCDQILYSTWSGNLVYGTNAKSFLESRCSQDVEIFTLRNEDIKLIYLRNETELEALHAKYTGMCSATASLQTKPLTSLHVCAQSQSTFCSTSHHPTLSTSWTTSPSTFLTACGLS